MTIDPQALRRMVAGFEPAAREARRAAPAPLTPNASSAAAAELWDLRPELFAAQVAGEIAVDFSLATVQLGAIQVNARTLKTDSGMRDRAIQNQIMDTAQYELITFAPKSISGLPQNAQPGDEIEVTITGDLTIRDITQEATFTGNVKLASLERLEGYASAIVLRSTYQLVIPQVPSVAGVDDDVLLEIEFVAIKK